MTKECASCRALNADFAPVCGNCGTSLPAAPPTPEAPAEEPDSRSDRWARVLSSSSESEPMDDGGRLALSRDTGPAGNAELMRIAEATERTAIATERTFLFMVISAVAAVLVGLVAFVLIA